MFGVMNTLIDFVRTNIIAIRKINGFSQEVISQKMHISRSAYARIESNRSIIDLPFLITFSEVLGMKIEDVLYFHEKKETIIIPVDTDLKDKYIDCLEHNQQQQKLINTLQLELEDLKKVTIYLFNLKSLI